MDTEQKIDTTQKFLKAGGNIIRTHELDLFVSVSCVLSLAG